jgi:hypothetical protein
VGDELQEGEEAGTPRVWSRLLGMNFRRSEGRSHQ